MAVSELTLRDATKRDLSALMEIELSQFPEPWSRRMLLDEIVHAENRRYRVATTTQGIVGYAGAMFVLDEVHLNTIGVRVGYERREIATALMEDFFNEARRRGIQRATLEVATSNVAARALYQRFGFAPVGIRKNYYPTLGEDALVMWADVVVPSVES